MKLLLDTHIFLWYISGSRQLFPAWEIILRDPASQVYPSAVSV
jgi:PIN domain nuclease of toxin-antitoxin system